MYRRRGVARYTTCYRVPRCRMHRHWLPVLTATSRLFSSSHPFPITLHQPLADYPFTERRTVAEQISLIAAPIFVVYFSIRSRMLIGSFQWKFIFKNQFIFHYSFLRNIEFPSYVSKKKNSFTLLSFMTRDSPGRNIFFLLFPQFFRC